MFSFCGQASGPVLIHTAAEPHWRKPPLHKDCHEAKGRVHLMKQDSCGLQEWGKNLVTGSCRTVFGYIRVLFFFLWWEVCCHHTIHSFRADFHQASNNIGRSANWPFPSTCKHISIPYVNQMTPDLWPSNNSATFGGRFLRKSFKNVAFCY